MGAPPNRSRRESHRLTDVVLIADLPKCGCVALPKLLVVPANSGWLCRVCRLKPNSGIKGDHLCYIFVSDTVKEDHIITFAPETQALSEHTYTNYYCIMYSSTCT